MIIMPVYGSISPDLPTETILHQWFRRLKAEVGELTPFDTLLDQISSTLKVMLGSYSHLRCASVGRQDDNSISTFKMKSGKIQPRRG